MCNDRIWTLLARKLSGEATPTEIAELDFMLSSSSTNQQSIDKVTQVWNHSTPQDNDFMEATYLAHLERLKQKGQFLENNFEEAVSNSEEQKSKRNFFSFNYVSVFSIIVLAILSGWIWVQQKQTTNNQNNIVTENIKEVVTQKGNRAKMQLPDGSNVWLNAGSKIHFDKNFDGKERVVYLTGEAFFDVVKNPKRPFIIHTSKIDIRVLGTQFNVKAYEEDNITETSLIHGSVEVFLKNNPGKKFLLRPNEKLVLKAEKILSGIDAKKQTGTKINTVAYMPQVAIKKLSYLKDNENVESSWTRNILSFDDETFGEVAKKMERWYNVNIRFENEKWQNKFLSGSFENETLDQALAALKFTTGFKFNIEGNNVSIY